MKRSWLLAAWTILVASMAFAQQPASGQQKSAGRMKETPHEVPTYEVKFEPDPKRWTSFQEDDNTAITSEGCDARGNPFVQVHRIIPPTSNEVLKFDEKRFVTFATRRISDIVEPKWIADFASGSELYMLIEGNTHTEQRTEKVEKGLDVYHWETTGEPRYYIGRFDADGSYKGALKLDLPFRPKRLSGFASGNFLVAGVDEDHMLRLALLDSRGQLLRSIEFAKEKKEVAEKTAMRLVDEEPPPVLEIAAWMRYSFISFLPYQDDVLYVRGSIGAPIYAINAGGEMYSVKIKPAEGYSLDYILPSDRNWFVVSTELGKDRDAKSVVDELSPSNGEVLARYFVEGAGREGAGPSDVVCFHDGQFVAVRLQEGKLRVLHGVPARKITLSTPN